MTMVIGNQLTLFPLALRTVFVIWNKVTS